MRIELTLDGPGGRRDVAVEAPSSLTLAEVARHLAASVGAAPDSELWCAGVRLDLAATFGTSGLRRGSLCSVGGPVATAAPPALLELQVVGGVPTGPPVPLRRGRVTIGRDPACDVVLDDDRASRRHAVLEIEPGRVVVRDLASTNGTSVDGVAVGPDGAVLEPGEVLRIGDALLATAGPTTPARTSPGPDATLVVNRPPRVRPDEPQATIELPEGATPTRPGRVQWLTAFVPVLGGVACAWALAAPQLLLLALLSPVMVVSGALGDRVHWRRDRRRAAADLRRRLAATGVRVAEALRVETARRRHAAPDPSAVLRTAVLPGTRLWERRPGDPDHLLVRLGSADLPSGVRTSSGGDLRPAGVVPGVPATVDLRDGPLGVAGPAALVAEVLRWSVGQLAVLHAPSGLELVLVVDADRRSRWRWCRWLPHLPGPGLADTAAAVAQLVARLERRRALPTRAEAWTGRWLVVVVDSARPGEIPGLGRVLLDGPAFGITAVCAADDLRALPDACVTSAAAEGAAGGRLTLRSPSAAVEVLADRVGDWWATAVARGLAPLLDPDTVDADLPGHVHLADLVPVSDPAAGTAALLDVWSAADHGARTPIGVARECPVVLDLVADGPHTLVAGTTGAGKSELLRTLVAGLAAAHPPDAMSFLLVDYKGGAAFADCARLPHTVGLVTDLDTYLTARALRSLHAELKRRERLFAHHRANDFDAFVGAEPLARLVIVVDEFAELAAELPDFVAGLIGVARRGRSLGVHLVLATQRPGSSVSPEIRANTSLRIALRVTDIGDSKDVVDTPDAAWLDPGHPGRAFVRTGRGLIAMQTATVTRTARTDDAPTVRPLADWGAAVPSDPGPVSALAALVDAIGRATLAGAIAPARSPWLPPLTTAIPLDALPDTSPLLGIGMLDTPDDQAQPVLTLDPVRDSTVLIVGRGGSGRTHALLTIAVAHVGAAGPDALHLHVVDGGGLLARVLDGLPHLGTVITPASAELVPVLLTRLLARARAGPDVRTLLLVDDWDRLLADRDDLQAAEWSELLARLLRAASTSVTVVLAGGRSLLPPRTAGGFGVRLLLELDDPGEAALVGVAPRDLPADAGPGRGVRVGDSVEFRLAHPGADPGARSARLAVGALIQRWSGDPPRRSPLRLRPLPTHVTLAAARAQGFSGSGVLLGLASDTAAPCAVDLLGTRARLLVAGPPRSGRTTLLRTVLAEAVRLAHPVLVLAPPRSPLFSAARRAGVPVLDPGSMPVRPPPVPTLLLVDDDEVLADTTAHEVLVDWLRDPTGAPAVVVAARSDDLATTYRGLAAEVRRSRCGVLLRPGPVDGELLGVPSARTPRRPGPPGRGLLVGDPGWGPAFASGAAVAIQVADPGGGSE